MRPTRTFRTASAAALLLGLFAAALSLTGGARLERADFAFNNGTEVTTLDPAQVVGIPEGRVIRALYEGLVVKHPRTLAPLPGMAESWEISADGLTYTFRIREGALWTNGDEVTAHDFVYTYKRLLHPKTAANYAYQLWYVRGARAFSAEVTEDGEPKHDFASTVAIAAPDDRTLVIGLESPTPFFLDLVGFYPLFPVNRRAIEAAQERWGTEWEIQWLRPEYIVTNGPFKLLDRRVNDRIRLEKNEDYWDAENVAFRSMDILAVEQDATMLNMYLTGSVDYIDRVNTNVVAEMMPREDFNPTPYSGSYYYRINVTRPPFDDKRIRRALSLTIPRKAICEGIMRMGQVPAYALVPPGIPGYTNAETRRGDLTEAKRLMAEAGYGPGGKTIPTIEIHYNTSEAHAAIAQIIALEWQNELGIRAKLRNEEWKVYLDTQNTLRYDISRSAWIADYADPNTFLDEFLTDGQNNRTGWSNAQYDHFLEQAAAELDPLKRMDLLRQAEAILMEELPILPIYYYVTQNAIAPRLGGFYENFQDAHFPKHWYWMDDAELAERRASLPADVQQVTPHGPAAGLYAPAHPKYRGAR